MSGELLRDMSVLEHMMNYCERIENAVNRFGNSFSDFINDEAYKDSVSMCVLQIGELTTHLTEDFKQIYSQVPWKEIVGMRNHFAHGYIEMDSNQIWKTVREDIPEIKAFCQNVFDGVYSDDMDCESELTDDLEL